MTDDAATRGTKVRREVLGDEHVDRAEAARTSLTDDFQDLVTRAARNNGVTVEELKEVLLQTAVYCGFPAANGAFRVAPEILG